MNVLFWGTPAFAVPSLLALDEEGHEVVGVVTQPDRPAGRGRHLRPSPVKEVAEAAGYPVLQPERPRGEEFLEAIRALKPDISVVVAYGHILNREVLDVPRFGSINVHASLLPELRGAAPINWAIARGYETTGVTIMRMVEAMDAGPILFRNPEPIMEGETASELASRLSEVGAETLIATLAVMEAGVIEEREQDHDAATYAPKVDRAVARVDWSRDARSRLQPHPGHGRGAGSLDSVGGRSPEGVRARGRRRHGRAGRSASGRPHRGFRRGCGPGCAPTGPGPAPGQAPHGGRGVVAGPGSEGGATPGVIPRLHVVTDDRIIAGVDFVRRAAAVLRSGGDAVALHVRGPHSTGRRLFTLCRTLQPVAVEVGALLVVNDRADVALSLDLALHLGGRSLPPDEARRLLGPDRVIGLSVHEPSDLETIAPGALDFALAGTFHASASHPERGARGQAWLEAMVAGAAVPLLAIGGVTPARVGDALRAGAHGVGVVSGVWGDVDPGRVTAEYLTALGQAIGHVEEPRRALERSEGEREE